MSENRWNTRTTTETGFFHGLFKDSILSQMIKLYYQVQTRNNAKKKKTDYIHIHTGKKAKDEIKGKLYKDTQKINKIVSLPGWRNDYVITKQ